MEVNLEGLPAILQSVTISSLVPAICYLIIGLILVKIVMGAFAALLVRSRVEKTLHKFILTLIRITLYFVVFMTVAAAIGVQITSFVAILSVAGLALSLAMQGVLSNIAGGVMILSVTPFKVGDYVEIGGMAGTVQEIGFIHTKIITLDNKVIFIPNSEVSSSKITNYNGEPIRRVDLVFTAAYTCDPEKVKAALMEATKHPQTLKDPAPFVRTSGYGRSIEYTVRAWCKCADYWDLYFNIIEAVPVMYKKHGVAMSHPHVIVHTVKD